MTDYHIYLNETLEISDSVTTQTNFTRTLNDSFFSVDFVTLVHNVVNFITSLGGLIS